MAVETSRLTLTTTAQKIAENDTVVQTEGGARRYEFLAQSATGTVLIGGTAAEAAGDDALRWDVALLMGWDITLEPGEEVWAKTSSGTVDLDRITSGR